MKKTRGLYRQRGYAAFKTACALHEKLFPHDSKSIDGGSRRMGAIYTALDRAYTDGIEDCLQLPDEEIQRMRKRLGGREFDV